MPFLVFVFFPSSYYSTSWPYSCFRFYFSERLKNECLWLDCYTLVVLMWYWIGLFQQNKDLLNYLLKINIWFILYLYGYYFIFNIHFSYVSTAVRMPLSGTNCCMFHHLLHRHRWIPQQSSEPSFVIWWSRRLNFLVCWLLANDGSLYHSDYALVLIIYSFVKINSSSNYPNHNKHMIKHFSVLDFM